MIDWPWFISITPWHFWSHHIADISWSPLRSKSYYMSSFAWIIDFLPIEIFTIILSKQKFDIIECRSSPSDQIRIQTQACQYFPSLGMHTQEQNSKEHYIFLLEYHFIIEIHKDFSYFYERTSEYLWFSNIRNKSMSGLVI